VCVAVLGGEDGADCDLAEWPADRDRLRVIMELLISSLTAATELMRLHSH